MGKTPPLWGSPRSPQGFVLVMETKHPTYFAKLVQTRGRRWGRGWGPAGGCREDKAAVDFGGPTFSLAQPQPPQSCWLAITSHYSLPRSSVGLNAAGFSWLLASTEEETLLSGDNHRGELRNAGPSARGTPGGREPGCSGSGSPGDGEPSAGGCSSLLHRA